MHANSLTVKCSNMNNVPCKRFVACAHFANKTWLHVGILSIPTPFTKSPRMWLLSMNMCVWRSPCVCEIRFSNLLKKSIRPCPHWACQWFCLQTSPYWSTTYLIQVTPCCSWLQRFPWSSFAPSFEIHGCWWPNLQECTQEALFGPVSSYQGGHPTLCTQDVGFPSIEWMVCPWHHSKHKLATPPLLPSRSLCALLAMSHAPITLVLSLATSIARW